jgi:short-subunit dehydrogenase
MNKKFALVTGAGSGIGKSIARELASREINVLLVALPGEDLEGYSKSLSGEFGITSHCFEIDLSLLDSPRKVIEWVQKKQYPVYFLVNNAGMAGTAVFEESDDRYIDDRILVNVRALTVLCRYFIPLLKEHNTSYILNVSSLSAYYAIPFKALYSSTKAFVLNFSRAIRTELKETSISVSVLCPNGVQTNAGTFSRIAAHGNKGKLTAVGVEKVARMAVEGALRKKFVIIPGRVNHLLLFISRLLPHWLEQRVLYGEFLKEVKVSRG